MTATLIAAALLAVSMLGNVLLWRRSQATFAELVHVRTELAYAVEQAERAKAYQAGKGKIAEDVKAKTARRLVTEPTAVEVRRTIGRIRRRNR